MLRSRPWDEDLCTNDSLRKCSLKKPVREEKKQDDKGEETKWRDTVMWSPRLSQVSGRSWLSFSLSSPSQLPGSGQGVNGNPRPFPLVMCCSQLVLAPKKQWIIPNSKFSLKLAIVGVFTPWKMVDDRNQDFGFLGFFFSFGCCCFYTDSC